MGVALRDVPAYSVQKKPINLGGGGRVIGIYFEKILLRLSISPIVQAFTILKQKEGDEEGYLRVKCKLCNSDVFEFSEYVVREQRHVVVETYNFHWQTAMGTLRRRWDNVAHHREIKTFPYHVHTQDGNVKESEPMS